MEEVSDEIQVVSWTQFTLVMFAVFLMLVFVRGYFNHPERIRRLKRPNMYKIRSTDRLSALCSIPEDQMLASSGRGMDLNRRRCA